MNVFDTHGKIIGDYASYIRSFINIPISPSAKRSIQRFLKASSRPTRSFSSTLPINRLTA
jgi:hypothetical protein